MLIFFMLILFGGIHHVSSVGHHVHDNEHPHFLPPYSVPVPSHPHSNLPNHNSFCGRSIARKFCPDPRTADGLEIEAFMGTWYQIGSTGRYKLSYESGLICEQANYTLIFPPDDEGLGARISVINSGASVISRVEALGISRLSQTIHGVCSNARTICSLVAPEYSRLRQAVRTLGVSISTLYDSHPIVAAKLTRESYLLLNFLKIIEMDMEFLANNVSQIQQIHSRLSQDHGLRRNNVNELTELVATTINAVRSFNDVTVYVENTRSVILSQAATLATEDPSLAFRLTEAAFDMNSELVKIQSSVAQILFSLKGMQVTSMTVGEQPMAIRWGPPPVRYGHGYQNSSSRGKLLMNFMGNISPYWILELEGSAREGYKAALVYLCREDLSGDIHEALFVLSRTRTLDNAVIQRFMETATRYGISADCDNPLVMTDQREGSCGAP